MVIMIVSKQFTLTYIVTYSYSYLPMRYAYKIHSFKIYTLQMTVRILTCSINANKKVIRIILSRKSCPSVWMMEFLLNGKNFV